MTNCRNRDHGTVVQVPAPGREPPAGSRAITARSRRRHLTLGRPGTGCRRPWHGGRRAAPTTRRRPSFPMSRAGPDGMKQGSLGRGSGAKVASVRVLAKLDARSVEKFRGLRAGAEAASQRQAFPACAQIAGLFMLAGPCPGAVQHRLAEESLPRCESRGGTVIEARCLGWVGLNVIYACRGPVRARNEDSAFVSTDTVQTSHKQSVIRSSLIQSVTETRS